MKRLAKWFGTLAISSLVGVVLFAVVFPSVTVRYRLTLEALVDGVSKGGSGVFEVVYSTNPRLLGAASEIQSKVTGEAITMDLGRRGLLLVLLAAGENPRSSPEDIIPYTFSLTQGGGGARDFKFIAALKGELNLPFDLLPLAIILSDPSNPSSVARVDGGAFPVELGQDVRLVRANIKILDDGIWPLSLLGISGTRPNAEIAARLPWLRNNKIMNQFWQSLYATGYRPNGSIELMSLFTRG